MCPWWEAQPFLASCDPHISAGSLPRQGALEGQLLLPSMQLQHAIGYPWRLGAWVWSQRDLAVCSGSSWCLSFFSRPPSWDGTVLTSWAEVRLEWSDVCKGSQRGVWCSRVETIFSSPSTCPRGYFLHLLGQWASLECSSLVGVLSLTSPTYLWYSSKGKPTIHLEACGPTLGLNLENLGLFLFSFFIKG